MLQRPQIKPGAADDDRQSSGAVGIRDLGEANSRQRPAEPRSVASR